MPTGEDLIAAKEVEAVIVASWGETHAGYVLAAIKAGKPVFCEKPMATRKPTARRLSKRKSRSGGGSCRSASCAASIRNIAR